MKRLRFLKLAYACAVLATACGHAADASFALKVTDFAKLGERPFRVDTVLGTQVRVYRDLAYSTRDDLPTDSFAFPAPPRRQRITQSSCLRNSRRSSPLLLTM